MSKSDVEAFFWSINPFYIAHWSTILSLWLHFFPYSSFPKQVSHSTHISKSWCLQSNFNITASCFNVLDPHMIFSAPPKTLGHFSSITLFISWLVDSTLLLLLSFLLIPWNVHLQDARFFCCNEVWPINPSSSLKGAKPQLFCMTTSYNQTLYDFRYSYTWPSPAAPLGPTLDISRTDLLCHS